MFAMIKLVAFDFDGTLADSVDFCLACFDKVFEKFMKENAPDREAIYQTFGMNEPGVIRYFMGGFVPEAEEYFFDRSEEKYFKSGIYISTSPSRRRRESRLSYPEEL